MFFIAYAFKGQVHVFAGQVKIVSPSSCRTSAILKYFCPLNYLTIIFRSILTQNIMYFWYNLQFFNLTLKSSLAKIVNINFSTRNLYILGENTSKYCSRIIVVHVHATLHFSLSWFCVMYAPRACGLEPLRHIAALALYP